MAIKLRCKLKFKLTDVVLCKGFTNWFLLKHTLERGFTCCSSVFFLNLSFIPKDKDLKTVEVTVNDTRDVG